MKAGPARDSLSAALWDAGMLVTTFQSLPEAEGLLVGGAVHAVLLDAAQGPALGTQLTWWLNAVGRGAVKVVLFGRLTAEQVVAALKGGVNHCLPTPDRPAEFALLLGETVGFEPVSWRR
jgi:DNA-binding NtrC family response regulator